MSGLMDFTTSSTDIQPACATSVGMAWPSRHQAALAALLSLPAKGCDLSRFAAARRHTRQLETTGQVRQDIPRLMVEFPMLPVSRSG